MPRRRATLFALATLAAAFAATTIGAAAAPQADAPHVAPSPSGATAVTADGATSGSSVEQTITQSVRGSGMSVAPGDATIVLTRDDSTGEYRGQLPKVTVTDARGSLTGWTLVAHLELDGASGAVVDVRPAQPEVIAGFSDGIAAGPTSHAHAGDDVVLATAAAGEGGGTFASPGATVTVRPGRGFSGPMAVHVAFATH